MRLVSQFLSLHYANTHSVASSLVPRLHFSCPLVKQVWSIAYSIFVHVRRNAGALFFSNLTLDVIEHCIANDLLAKWTLIDQPIVHVSIELGCLRVHCLSEYFQIHNPVDVT